MSSVKRNIYVITKDGEPISVATSQKRAYEIILEEFCKEYKIVRFDNDQLNQ